MKRFMAKFIGTTAAKQKIQQQQQQPKSEPTGGVAFVQPEQKKKDYTICHACGYTYEEGLDKYNQISEPVSARIKKMVKDGVFDGNGGNAATTTAARKPTKKKQGTANEVVEEEDDGEETEVEEDGFPPREHLLQMLRMSNALIGNVKQH